MPKPLRIIIPVFVAVGVAMLMGCAFLVVNTRHLEQTATRVSGQVVGLDSTGRTYHPVVEFRTPAGQRIRFTSSAGSNPPAFHPGETVTVLYESGKPWAAHILCFTDLWLGPVVLGVLGTVFTAIPVGILLTQAQIRKRDAWLKQNGQRISVQFDHVDQIAASGTTSYRIVALGKNPFTNESQAFHSEYLKYDPTAHAANRAIDVLIDPKDPRRYWLDTGFLPEVVDYG